MDRREFFGAAAATSVAAVVPSRYEERFARTLEDREVASPKEDVGPVVFKLYADGVLVHEQETEVAVKTKNGEVYYGVGESVVMKGFEGRADRLTVGIPAIPQFENDSTPTDRTFPVCITRGNTLTLQADKKTGFLKVY